ncbi:MAG: SRPBCC domain-containing protein [Mycobacteriales bacterium]
MSGTTPQHADIVYTRVFDAPRALVFQCMTEPEHLTHFWGPTGMNTPLDGITVDARPGGAFETVMVNDSDGSTYQMRAVFDEIVAPERMVWTEPGSGVTTTSTFRDLGESRTEVRIEQANVPEAFRSPEAQAGFATSLDRLAAYVSKLATDRGTSS